MTAAPVSRRGEPWTDADDHALRALCASVGRGSSSRAAKERAEVLAAEVCSEMGRTPSALQTRLRLLHSRGDVGALAAQRASSALGAVSRAAAATKPDPPKPAEPKREPGPPVPLPRIGLRGRDLGPRPPSAPPPETWPDGVDPWRVAVHQRGIGVPDRAIASLLGQLCDPRCAPARTIAGPLCRGGLWSAEDVRALLGETKAAT